MSATEIPRSESGPRYVRLQAELVLELTAGGELRAAALSRIGGDAFMPAEERAHAERAVGEDESEALAYLVDPCDLVSGVPGVELVQASWSCAHTEYEAGEDDDWGLEEDEADDEEGGEGEEEVFDMGGEAGGDEGAGGGGAGRAR